MPLEFRTHAPLDHERNITSLDNHEILAIAWPARHEAQTSDMRAVRAMAHNPDIPPRATRSSNHVTPTDNVLG